MFLQLLKGWVRRLTRCGNRCADRVFCRCVLMVFTLFD